jgi:hypothetical protein
MCNPRRIRVQATQELAEAWEQEVRRRVALRGQVTGEARVREPLGATLGAPTLAALNAVLDRTEGWHHDGEALRHELDGGYVRYHAATRELEIVAVATESVEAVGEAAATARGSVSETVSAEGTGTYYDDMSSLWYRLRARQQARRDANSRLAAELDRARRAARRRLDDTEGAAVQEQAQGRAQEQFDRLAAERSPHLREQATWDLMAVGAQARGLFHQAMAEAYRDAIMAFARSRHAEGLMCTERDGVVEIEFEYEA